MRRQILVALEQRPDKSIASHTSAALIHGLPLVGAARSTGVHLTTTRASGSRSAKGLTLHSSPTPPQAVEVNSLQATTVPRTVVDLARTSGFIAGVCAADAALHKGLTTPAELANEVANHRGRTGAATARSVVNFADGLSESPGESFSRCLISTWDEIPAPRLQHEFHNKDGRFVARSDFDWKGRLVGEFDGYTKYSGLLRQGEDPGQAAWREKRREDGLQGIDVIVVRWIWADVERPTGLRTVLRDGLRRAGLL